MPQAETASPHVFAPLHVTSIRPADTAMFVQPADTAMYLKAAGNRLTQPTHMCLMHSPRYHRYNRLTQPCVCHGVIGGDITGDLCSLVYSIAIVFAIAAETAILTVYVVLAFVIDWISPYRPYNNREVFLAE